MTQEDKELLLKDLCARLPYGVKVKTNRGPEIIEGLAPFCHNEVKISLNFDWSLSISDFTPYLRPMSSMTEDEKKELFQLMGNGTDIKRIDFYISHHFDYRGLIEKGLALEAPEGMYNIK